MDREFLYIPQTEKRCCLLVHRWISVHFLATVDRRVFFGHNGHNGLLMQVVFRVSLWQLGLLEAEPPKLLGVRTTSICTLFQVGKAQLPARS